MTNSRAIDLLFNGWLIFTFVLAITLIAQALGGRYGSDWPIPLQWAFAMVAPSLTLMTAARRNKGKGKWKDAAVDTSNFRLAMWVSAIIWVGTVAMFVYGALGTTRIYEILPVTGLAFTLAQTVVIGAVSSIIFANR